MIKFLFLSLILCHLFQKNSLLLAASPSINSLIIKTPNSELKIPYTELKDLTQKKTFTNIPYGEKTQTLLAIDWEVLKKKNFSHPDFPLSEQSFFLDPNSIITFTCLDGFSATLETSHFLHAKYPRPYLVIEDPDQPWPPIKESKNTPGPMALLWEDPQNKIGSEQMPYQLKMLEWKQSLKITYPKLFPSKKSFSASEKKGFLVFTKNCFSCHKLNNQGEAIIGPDLNLPKSPIEYFQLSAFKQFIRDPKSLRFWPESKMPGFDQAAITEIEIDHLINYLTLMSQEKNNLKNNLKNSLKK